MFKITVSTSGQGLYDVTDDLRRHLAMANFNDGVVTIFIQHTSASLLIQENADPTVQKDLVEFFCKIAPETDTYLHDAEGPDDMPAHIKSALTQTSLSIPVVDGSLALGTWQGIYVFEHRKAPHQRQLVCALTGSDAT